VNLLSSLKRYGKNVLYLTTSGNNRRSDNALQNITMTWSYCTLCKTQKQRCVHKYTRKCKYNVIIAKRAYL